MKPKHAISSQENLDSPGDADGDERLEQNIRDLLSLLGENPSRDGLQETPSRAARAWREWTRGYRVDPERVLKTFPIEGSSRSDLIVVRDIPVYSHCEHHLAPFFGMAHVCYVPNRGIVGLSKLTRLVDVFARRLQVQERLTQEIVEAISDGLAPRGAGVILECRHLCMESRGVRRQGSTTITSSFRGILESEPSIRAEFIERTR
ncbi:GTP cyclohydrolase I FolE [Sorangium sp. So ce1128]